MTITVSQYFDRYSLNMKEISDLIYKYKSSRIILIQGTFMMYSFELEEDLSKFLLKLSKFTVSKHKRKSLRTKLCKFIHRVVV